MSPARLEHFVFGLVLWGLYLWLRQQRRRPEPLQPLALLITVPVVYLATTLPDWDLWLLGIGRHRNPLFHSAIPYFLLAWLWRKSGAESVAQMLGGVGLATALYVGFSVGLASHLLLDVWQYGDVRWIRGRTLDKLWLASHAVLLLGVAWAPHAWLGRRRAVLDSHS